MSETTSETPTPSVKPLRRSRTDRMLAGVCGGLGEYFNLNPTFFRVGFVVLTLVGGAGILIYFAAALVMPDEGEQDSIAADVLRHHRDRPWAVIGLGAFALAAVVLLSHASWPRDGGLWLLVLLAGGALIWSQRRERGGVASASAASAGPGAPPAPPRRSLTLPVLGVLIAGAGLLGLLEIAGASIPWDIALAVAAIGVGAAVVGGALARWHVTGLIFVGLVLGVAAAAAASIHIPLHGGVGDLRATPATIHDVKSDYHLAVGDLDLDLSRVRPGARKEIDASVGVGQLHVTVPRGVTVRVESNVSMGEARVLGHDANGHDVNDTVVSEGNESGELVLHADVGLGELHVERAVR